MLIFPQLSTGASTQYPVGKKVSLRSVQSAMADGTIISLADTCATYLRWKIVLQDLTDLEATALSNFFAATQANLQPFLFLDPTANLLLWSNDFTQNAWTKAGVTFDPTIEDPFGGSSATRANNQTAAGLSIAQQSQIPGSVQTCFSIYMKADAPITITLMVSAGSQSQSVEASVTTNWQRFYISGALAGATGTLQFAINLPAGVSVALFGPQVDAQVTPSRYVATSGWCGVCTNARFDGNQLDRVATGPNRNSCVTFVRCNLPGGE